MCEETEFRPKPMVEVGGRPVLLWHIMKILGHYGISEFVVCTGYNSEYIKGYFSKTATQPMSRFGVIDLEQDRAVAKFREKPKTGDWINIGYFIFEPGNSVRSKNGRVASHEFCERALAVLGSALAFDSTITPRLVNEAVMSRVGGDD
jgi:NDP-sugar pyrophosphorylase family protein